jgi:hypothetical protein
MRLTSSLRFGRISAVCLGLFGAAIAHAQSGTGELGSFNFDSANPTSGLVATGAPAISILNSHTPPNSLSLPAGNNYEVYTLSSATSVLYTRQYIDISSIGSTSNAFLRLYHGGSQLMSIFLNSPDAHPSYYNQATGVTTTMSSSSFPTGSIHLVELYVKMSATAGQVICKIDGTAVYTSAATLNTGTSTIDTVWFGQIGNTAPVGWGTTYMDNVDFSAINWIGPISTSSGSGTPTMTQLFATPRTAVSNSTVEMSALVSTGGYLPTGTVTFANGGTSIGTATLSPVSATNLLPYTILGAHGDIAGIGGTPTYSANSQVAPDGTATAETISFPAYPSAGTYGFAGQYSNVTPTAGSTYTFSIWLKAPAPTQVQINMIQACGSNSLSVVVNVGSSWQRYSLTETMGPPCSGVLIGRLVESAPSSAAVTYAWGAQLEQAAQPGPFVAAGNAVAANLFPRPADAITGWNLSNSCSTNPTLTSGNAVAPDGTTTASTYAFADSTAGSGCFSGTAYGLNAGTSYDGQAVTFSILVKSAVSQPLYLFLTNFPATVSIASNSCQLLAGQYTRCYVSGVGNGTGLALYIRASGEPAFSAAVWGIKVELSANPTPLVSPGNASMTGFGGAATLFTTSLPVGSNQITAAYSGDSLNAASNSQPTPVVISQPGVGAPVITGISPGSGSPGTSVTITGSAFGAAQGSSSVSFNGIPATVKSWGSGTISVTVPAGATSGNGTITVNGNTSNGLYFAVTGPPSLTGLSLPEGPVGMGLVINGQNFTPNTGSISVNLGSFPMTVIAATSTQITVRVPQGAVSGAITVTTSGLQASGSLNFQVDPAFTCP